MPVYYRLSLRIQLGLSNVCRYEGNIWNIILIRYLFSPNCSRSPKLQCRYKGNIWNIIAIRYLFSLNCSRSPKLKNEWQWYAVCFPLILYRRKLITPVGLCKKHKQLIKIRMIKQLHIPDRQYNTLREIEYKYCTGGTRRYSIPYRYLIAGDCITAMFMNKTTHKPMHWT